MQPMLATAALALPDGPGWSYEFKWDGVRALIEIRAGRAMIGSRTGNDVTVAYPELAELGGGSDPVDDALLDGEIVAFDDGRPSFGLLQTRMHVRDATQAARLAVAHPVSFIAFDLLRLYGVDLTPRPLAERRATLERLARGRSAWAVSPAFDDASATSAAARAHGLEGVVAKRLSAPYRPGSRAADWVKVRFLRRGEFLVVGWEADAARPGTLSSLLLGCLGSNRAAELRFAGKVGSGVTGRVATQLQAALTPRPSSALAHIPAPSSGRVVTWTEPSVVVEVSYSQWAEDGRLRQPVFLGMRSDKMPEEVTCDG